MDESTSTSFLTLPPEIRNLIYELVFAYAPYQPSQLPRLQDHGKPESDDGDRQLNDPTSGALTLVCRRLCAETQRLHLGSTHFTLSGRLVDPKCFESRYATLGEKRSAIRHLVLHARISHLRAIHETWHGLPFGNASLYVDTLTLVPCRPATYGHAVAEVADLSQVHTLAYLLAETLKSLRHVRVISVVNLGCFRPLLWRLVYRSLIYRLWKWGEEAATCCGLMFREVDGDARFDMLCAEGLDSVTVGPAKSVDDVCWRNAAQEISRLTGVSVKA